MSNQKISACVFPDTVPADDIMFPLAHIFSQLVYCQPVEMDGEKIEMADYLQIHVPAPLKGERDRFLSLLDELRSWSDDDAEQLRNLALFQISTGKPETKSSIISSLHNSMGVDDRKTEELEILLWQARLVLSLGEFFDQGQKELANELVVINEREKELFAELRQENSQSFDLARTINETIVQNDGLQRLRLKAWSRLFCFGSEPLHSVDCFISIDRNAIDMMVEVYEKIFGNNIKPFITLSLPVFTPVTSIQVDKIKQLQQAELPVILSWIFSGSAGRASGIDYDYEILQADWEELIDSLYPVTGTDRVTLHIYKFLDIQPCNLFLESFAREGVQVPIEKENQRTGVIICWLEK